MVFDPTTIFVIAALAVLISLCLAGAVGLLLLARTPAPPLGYLADETCNRNDCNGTIYDEAEAEGYRCYCMATSCPPCSFCENPHEVCDTCDWRAEHDW